jgi:hypothetical protein
MCDSPTTKGRTGWRGWFDLPPKTVRRSVKQWIDLTHTFSVSVPRSALFSRRRAFRSLQRCLRAGGSRRSLALARSLPPALIAEVGDWKAFSSGQSSQHGSVWFPSNIRRAARSGLARSQRRAIDICDGCSSPGPWLSFGMRDSMVRSGSGSRA